MGENNIMIMILLQIVLIALNAIFACAEIAVISMNDNKLAKMAAAGDKRAKRLVNLTNEPARFLATIQVAITLSGFLGSAFAAENFSGVLVDFLVGLGVPIPESVLDSIAVIFITIILSYFTLVFGELVPKQVAMRKAESLALLLSGLISGVAKMFAPIVSFLTASTNLILRLMGINPDEEDDNVSEEEIRMMVDVGSEKGTIDDEEREFIQNVFEFDDLFAEEVATHRTDVIMLDDEDSIEKWKEIILETRHSYYPIYQETIDRIIGVLNAFEYLRLEDKSKESIMEKAVSAPYFVLSKIKADVLFKNMKKEKKAVSIVLDEYGGFVGIITLNDLIEELVGEISDNSINEELYINEVQKDVWMVNGTASLEDLEKALSVTLKYEDFDTLNGLIFHALGNIPEDGSSMELTIGPLWVKILEIQKHQVKSAIVKKI